MLASLYNLEVSFHSFILRIYIYFYLSILNETLSLRFLPQNILFLQFKVNLNEFCQLTGQEAI